MKKIFTVSVLDDSFESASDAFEAWVDAGMPRGKDSSVWITEHSIDESGNATTMNTITIWK